MIFFPFFSHLFVITTDRATSMMSKLPSTIPQTAGPRMSKPKILSPDESDASVQPLLRLACAHFTSQALNAVVKLGVPDILGDDAKTIGEIASEAAGSPNEEALGRSMRLLCTAGVFNESFRSNGDPSYALTSAGALLQTQRSPLTQPSLACCVSHWTDKPLWDAWSALPDYVAGRVAETPFESANGMTFVEFMRRNPQSAVPYSEFVRFVSAGEIPALLDAFDWESLSGSTVVDVGGGHGAFMTAVADRFPSIDCVNLDLPEVVAEAPVPRAGVRHLGGDMFDPSTIPPCDTIVMKHVLADWDDKDCVAILTSCRSALPDHGRVVIAEVSLPDGEEANRPEQTQVFVDTLLMLAGNRGERTKSRWAKLAAAAGFEVELVAKTSSLSVDVTLLTKAEDTPAP